MDRADLVDTTRRVLRCIAERTLETAAEARSYPAALFTDRCVWVWERQRLLLDLPPTARCARFSTLAPTAVPLQPWDD
jgi:hypothetical protein